MRGQLNNQVAIGKDRDGVYQYFIDTYGSQEPIGAPIGAFNQLSRLFPILVGGVCLVGVGFVAVRWSRRDTELPASQLNGATDGPNQELEARLDDELRNLD